MTDATCFIEHAAWRNSVNGAWFIEALCQVLEDHGQEKNLLWMITKVSRIVATQKESETGWKQMPCVVSPSPGICVSRPKRFSRYLLTMFKLITSWRK